MKANELMIGDWGNIYVFPNENPKCKDLFPAKITAILTPTASESSGNTIECMFTALDGTGGVGYASRPPETFLPIPLTEEILEKNGFVPDNFSPYYLPIKDGSVRFSKHQYGLYCNILRPYQRYDRVCNYVHNLQHALRECGIDKEIVL